MDGWMNGWIARCQSSQSLCFRTTDLGASNHVSKCATEGLPHGDSPKAFLGPEPELLIEALENIEN